MILTRILLILGFSLSFLITIGGFWVLSESKRDPDIEWSDSSTVLLFTYCVIDILSLAACIWAFL